MKIIMSCFFLSLTIYAMESDIKKMKYVAESQANGQEEDVFCVFITQVQLDNNLINAINDENIAKVEEALKNGANPNLVIPAGHPLNMYEHSVFLLLTMLDPIMFAREERNLIFIGQVIGLLIKNGADIGMKDGEGNTILHQAAGNNNIGVIDTLLKNGADPMALNNEGMSCLHQALSWHFKDESFNIGDLIIKNASFFILKRIDRHNDTLLHIALENENYKLFSLILRLIVTGFDRSASAKQKDNDISSIIVFLNHKNDYDSSGNEKVTVRDLIVSSAYNVVADIFNLNIGLLIEHSTDENNLNKLREMLIN